MLIKSFDLQQLVTKPTRVTDTTATVIDHIYISDGLEVQEVSVPEVSLSDHFPVAMTISNSKTKTDGSHKVIEHRGKPTINYYMLLKNIKENLSDMTFARNVDPNSNVNRFNKVLLDSYDKYCPLIQKRVKNEQRVPWINEDVKIAMRLKDKMKSTKKTVKYKFWRNHCVKLIRSNKTKVK